MVDINVRTEGIRSAFAYNDALQIDLVGIRSHLTAPGCTLTNLPGCKDFREADQRTSDEAARMLTRADQLVKGLRQGAKRQADLYDHADAEAADALKKLSPQERDLPPIDGQLELAQRLGNPDPR